MNKNKKPYLIIKHFSNPVPGTNTSKKGWKDEGLLEVTEHPELKLKVSRNDWMEAAVIIDIFEKKALKNRLINETDDEIVKFYCNLFKKQIGQFVARYMMQYGNVKKFIADALEHEDERELVLSSIEQDSLKVDEQGTIRKAS